MSIQASKQQDVRKGWTLALVCAAVFMLLLDVTIVTVALGPIQQDFGSSLGDLQWIIDAYSLALAGLLLTAATIGDRLGRRRVFLAGLAVFTLGSLLCAVAWSSLSLDLMRVIQGTGAAMLFGTAIPIIGATFTDAKERASAIGAFGGTLAGATAVGPLVGGALVDGPGWRWIFIINVPVGLAALVGGVRFLAESRAIQPRKADWAGTVALTLSLLALLFALIRGHEEGWTSAIILGLFSAAAILLVLFVIREATADEPMLDLSLFASRSFSALAVASVAITASLIAATSYLGLYFINTLGYTPFETGVRVLPLTIASFVAAPIGAKLVEIVEPRWMIGGSLVLVTVGMIMCTQLNATSTWTSMAPGFVVGGAGLGIGSACLAGAALSAVEPSRAGMASGVLSTMRQVGTAAGVAILGVIFTGATSREMTTQLEALRVPTGSATQLADGVGSGLGSQVAAAVPVPLRDNVIHAAASSTATGMNQVFAYGAVVAAIGAVVSLIFIRRTYVDTQADIHPEVETDIHRLTAAS